MSRSLARIAVMGLAAMLIAVFARAGEAPPERTVPENAQVTRFTRFNIRYRLRDIVAQGVQKVDFYITKDLGKTWEYYGEDPDKASPMTVEVPGEGVYGFVCVVTDRNGNREREPRAGARPETVIVVDRTPPTAKWISPTQDILGRGSHVDLEWEAADDYFTKTPVKIQYASDAQNNHDKNAKWQVIQENLPAKGALRWSPPDSLKYHFRLVAEDRAGNAAVAYCPASIKVDNTAPAITAVKPLKTNKLDNNIAVEAKDEDGGSGVKEFSLYTSDNGSATWNLVKETGVGGESVPVRRRPGDAIAWKAPKSGEYPLWPVVFDEAGNATPLPSVGVAGPYIMVVDTEPPSVSLSNSFLMNGSSILSNQSRMVEWTSYDPHPKEGTTRILLSVDNGKNYQELASRLAANGFQTVNFPFGVHGRECKIKITVEDDFGNVGEAVSETFRLSGAQTTVDSVTPRPQRPGTDAAEDIFGSGGDAQPGLPTPPSSGGWFDLGGGDTGTTPSAPSGSTGFGFGDLPALPGLSGGADSRPTLPSLPSGGLPGAGSFQPLPSLPGGDSYGGSGQDIYGGGSDSYQSEPQAGGAAVDWRTVSAAGPLPGAIIGNTLEPDPDAPDAPASASGLPPGLGGLVPQGAGRPGDLASADDEWQPSPLGGRTTASAIDEPPSYLSGDRMPWESDSSIASTSTDRYPPLFTGSSEPTAPAGGGFVPTPPGGGMMPSPPGGLRPSEPAPDVASAPWRQESQLPPLTQSTGGDAPWEQDLVQPSQPDYSADWASGGLPTAPGDFAASSIPQATFDSEDDWSDSSDLASASDDYASGDDSFADDMSDWSSSPGASGSATDSFMPPAPTGSLRPPSSTPTPPVATEPEAPQTAGSGLPLPPLGGGELPGLSDDLASGDFPALPGLDQLSEGGFDDFMAGIPSSGTEASELPALTAPPEWSQATETPSLDDDFADSGDDAGESESGRGAPWLSRTTTEMPPETPQGPPPEMPGLEQAPTSGVFQPPPLQTSSGQRPVNKRQESEHFIRESKAFREEGRPDLAMSSATKAVEADPTNANAYMELSQVNARMAPPDHVRAANLAKEATNLRADWETWWNCADIFYIWAHACNREVQSMSRSGQTPPVNLVDERNSTLSNALIAVNNAASVLPQGDREAAKKIGITQGMVTYLRALTVPEPPHPGVASGPAMDEYRRQQNQYKSAVSPLLLEAVPYFKNVLDMGGAPGYQETFQLGIIYFRLAGLERDTGNPELALTNYQDAVRYLEQATTASDTPKEGPREAYYMLALSHDQLAEQPGSNRARQKELALRYWRQTADFYDAGSAYRTYAEQRIEAIGREMGM